nr:MAG TPA: hypothetical protein [Caudoviricetes sp.]
MVSLWSSFGQYLVKKYFKKALDITLILAYNKSIKRGETQGG